MKTSSKMLLSVSCSACLATAAFAGEVTWTGNGSGWADANNWSATPEEGDIAVIPANVTAPVASSDLDAFRAFGGYRLEAGSVLCVNSVTFTSTKPFDKPLTGTGTLLLSGGSTYLKSDNSGFGGTFAFTNNYVEVHSERALGTTNRVMFGRTSQFNTYHIKIDRADGPRAVTNEFHFAAPNARSYAFESIKSPLGVCGPVYIDAGWCQFLNDSSTSEFYTEFHGGILGEGYMFCGNQPQSELTVIDCDVDLGGGLVAYDGGFTVKGQLKRGCLGLEQKNKGFKFMAANLCHTNDVLIGEWQISKNGGYLDLNGFDQAVGNVCERIDHQNTPTESDFYFTSAGQATLTVVGTPNRRYDENGFAGCLTGAISLCYDWDGRDGPKAYYTGCTAGLFRFTGNGSTTTGGVTCRRGTVKIESTAAFPNLTALGVSDTGKMTVSAGGIGAEGTGLVVRVADSGVLTIGADVTIAAKTASVGGTWLKPGTYGGKDSSAPVKLTGLAGTGLLTVAEFGGPKGLAVIIR